MKKATVSDVRGDLSRYLRLAEDEEIVITRRGKAIARLVPAETGKPDVEDIIQQMEDFQKKRNLSLGPLLTIRQMMEEGRK